LNFQKKTCKRFLFVGIMLKWNNQVKNQALVMDPLEVKSVEQLEGDNRLQSKAYFKSI
jgi:hypothetical protein